MLVSSKVRVISRKALRDFWQHGHADAEAPLKAWFKETEKAAWTSTTAIKKRYASASFLPGNRVVFNVGGNKYRLVAAIRFDLQIVFIRFVGTHAAYDRIDAEEV